MAATISGDGTSTLINLTTSGNTVLGDASTDTLNVGNGGLVKDASGRVGIGTASPATTLHLRSAVCNVRLEDADTSAYANVGVDNSGSMYLQADPANSQASSTMYFSIDGTEAARITSSGQVFVNTTSSLNGTLENFQLYPVTSGSSQYGMMIGGNAQGYTVYAMRFLNTYTPAVVGSITIGTTSTAYNTSSDYRLKHDIEPMTGALAKVAALKPVTYKWNADDSDGEGFIAHELAEVAPQAVVGEKDAVDEDGSPVYQGIDTSFLVATLTAAIQEQQAIITALQADVEALKAQP